MITVENWMSKPIVSVKPDDTVFSALKKMVKNDIGDVLVVKDKKPVGILTERDIIKRLLMKKLDPQKTEVKKIMTKKLVTADVNMSLLQVSRIMKKGDFRRMPVTRAGKVVGIVTSRDLVRFMSF
jgi:CBS domain-containing protein